MGSYCCGQIEVAICTSFELKMQSRYPFLSNILSTRTCTKESIWCTFQRKCIIILMLILFLHRGLHCSNMSSSLHAGHTIIDLTCRQSRLGDTSVTCRETKENIGHTKDFPLKTDQLFIEQNEKTVFFDFEAT